MSSRKAPRIGCKDIWNSEMVSGASFIGDDEIPFCPTTLTNIPDHIIPYDMTKSQNNPNALVHFYQDDYKFDGERGIWLRPHSKLTRLAKFGGVITPDFSTYQDMPRPIKVFSTYKMRAIGRWLGMQGIPAVNNVRWGEANTYEYSFAGLPYQSILAISTHGCIKDKFNRLRFQRGLEKMLEKLDPHTLLVYGSIPDSIFKSYRERSSLVIKNYPSQISQVMAERRKLHE